MSSRFPGTEEREQTPKADVMPERIETDFRSHRNIHSRLDGSAGMIYTLFFRRYAPFSSFGGGFEGDHRKAASTGLTSSARTTGFVSFAPGNVGDISAGSSGTAFTGAGAFVQRMLGRHMSKVTSSVTVKTRTIDHVHFTAQTAGANPMIPLAPDIDTYVDVDVLFRKQALEISGTMRGDNFPNAEAFVVDAKGTSRLLFEYATSGGQNTGPMTRLAGDNSAQILGSFAVRVSLKQSGAFVAK